MVQGLKNSLQKRKPGHEQYDMCIRSLILSSKSNPLGSPNSVAFLFGKGRPWSDCVRMEILPTHFLAHGSYNFVWFMN